jgi:hypothetical protein
MMVVPVARRTSQVAIGVLALALAACGDDSPDRADAPATDQPVVGDPGPVHVHGLGINPEDGALFIATHTGLFRAPEDDQKARRVGDRYQDTMGFTVVGPDRFLGSGHPDGRDNLPPFLGLIETRDAGRRWKPISLLGDVDFHVLEAAGSKVYGFGSDFDSREARLLVSDDGGRNWQRRKPPEPLVGLAIDPTNADHVVASGESGLYVSRDAARTWRPLAGRPGLLAWTSDGTLHAVDFSGRVQLSADDGRSWEQRGDIDGQPAAFDSAADELYVALHDGTVKRSDDHGRSWQLRSRP